MYSGVGMANLKSSRTESFFSLVPCQSLKVPLRLWWTFDIAMCFFSGVCVCVCVCVRACVRVFDQFAAGLYVVTCS